MAVRLIAEEGTLSGLVLSLEEGVQWQVGRDPSQNDIVLEDKKVASSQALFFKNEKGFFLRNLDQKVPIKVNDKIIKQDVLLNDHDTILLGGTLFSLINDVSDDVNDLFIFDQENNDDSTTSETGTKDHSESQKEEKEKKERKKKSSKNQEKTKEKNIEPSKNQQQVLLPEKKQDTQSEQKMKKDKDVPKNMDNQEENKQIPLNVQNNHDQDQKKQDKVLENDSIQSKEKNKINLENTTSSEKDEGSTLNQKNSDSDKVSDLLESKNSKKQVEDVTVQQTKISESEKQDKKNVNTKNEKELLSKSESNFSTKNEEKIDKKNDKLTFNIEDLFDFDDGIFPEIESNLITSDSDYFVDLSHVSRFLLKVISGPNIGAEYSLDLDHEYLLGSDSSKCDIVFNDLSVSHQHAKLKIDHEGVLSVEDLSSRNGIVIEGNHIEKESKIIPDQFVGLGTTVFVIIDHQIPAETIVASPFLDMHEFKDKSNKEDQNETKKESEIKALVDEKVQEELTKDKDKTFISMGSLIIALCMGGFAVLFGIGTASLFHSQEITLVPEGDYEIDLENTIQSFPGVKFTFNKNSGQLFLLGHVKNNIDKSELLYKLEALQFVKSIDDNIIDDEAVWQEMNIMLSKQLNLKGISMHSPEPGSFVITGYVKTDGQLNELLEFLNLHFNYLSLLSNRVYVENDVVSEIKELLFKDGLTGLNVDFSMGELILTGYINNKDQEQFQHLLSNLSKLSGVKSIKNFTVILPLEEGVIDLSRRYPNRYQVTGYSKHGDVNINIVINGKILMRGDSIDGMTITSIQANSVFLEKDGLKYKIDYNK